MNPIVKKTVIKNIVRKIHSIRSFLLGGIIAIAASPSQAATSPASIESSALPIAGVHAHESNRLLLAQASRRSKDVGQLKMREKDKELTVQWDAESFPMLRILHLSDGGRRQIVALDARGGEVVVPTNNLPAGGRWEIILINGKNEIHRKIPRQAYVRNR